MFVFFVCPKKTNQKKRQPFTCPPKADTLRCSYLPGAYKLGFASNSISSFCGRYCAARLREMAKPTTLCFIYYLLIISCESFRYEEQGVGQKNYATQYLLSLKQVETGADMRNRLFGYIIICQINLRQNRCACLNLFFKVWSRLLPDPQGLFD